MRGLLATLSVISAIASLSLPLSSFVATPNREASIIIWAATLVIAVIAGTIARKQAVRNRVGLGRSTIGLMVSICALIVGIIAYLT